MTGRIMGRRFFHVTPVEGGWEVREDPQSIAWGPFFTSSADALVAAMEAARHCWESQRVASGVRVQDHVGRWRDEVLFGSGLPLTIKRPSRLTRSHRIDEND